MNFRELQTNLENLTNTRVSLTEIGNALGIKLSTVSTRAKNNSTLKFDEIKRIEKYFNLKLIDESRLKSEPITYKNSRIKNMIEKMGIGISAYGIYRALLDIISEKGIKSGSEIEAAGELNTAEKYIKLILNDFDLFYIRNNEYCSVFDENAPALKSLNSEQFNLLKTELYKELSAMFQKENIH